MRIDNNTGMTDMRNTESSADKTVGKGNTQDGAAKKLHQGTGLQSMEVSLISARTWLRRRERRQEAWLWSFCLMPTTMIRR